MNAKDLLNTKANIKGLEARLNALELAMRQQQRKVVTAETLKEISPDLGSGTVSDESIGMKEFSDSEIYLSLRPSNGYEFLDENNKIVARMTSSIDELDSAMRNLDIEVVAPVSGGVNKKAKIRLSTWDEGELKTNSLIIDGETGCVDFAIPTTSSVSTGAGTVKMAGTTARTNTGWLKILVGGSARYIPYWTTIT